MKFNALAITCLLFFISLPTFAHSGHDHSSIMSGLVHLAWLAPLLIAGIYIYSKVLKRNYRINAVEKDSKE